MNLEGPTTMAHERRHSALSLLAAARTGEVAPAQAADKEPNLSPARAREIAVDTHGAEDSRGRPSGALVGRAGR
jgi:hypothetical protein